MSTLLNTKLRWRGLPLELIERIVDGEVGLNGCVLKSICYVSRMLKTIAQKAMFKRGLTILAWEDLEVLNALIKLISSQPSIRYSITKIVLKGSDCNCGDSKCDYDRPYFVSLSFSQLGLC